jgi:hypothetical protein
MHSNSCLGIHAASLLVAAFVATLPSGTLATEVLGTKPGYLLLGPSSVANEAAMTRRIWAPGLDDGYVPQGLTFAEGHVLIGGYRSIDPKVGRGPCRVFRVDATSGSNAGHFDGPSDCGHAGGLAYLGNDELLLSDTRRLYRIKLSRALAEKSTEAALLSSVKLGGAVKGSFVSWDSKLVWLGSSEKEADKARLHAFDLATIERFNGKGVMKEEHVVRSIAIGAEAQGAAFDRDGGLWLSFSSSRFGELRRIDVADGRVLAAYRMPIGIEDLGFDDEGGLWSVSEAGSQRWSKWGEQFPIVFRIDTAKLAK